MTISPDSSYGSSGGRPALAMRALEGWRRFWFTPSDPGALGVARAVFFGALFLLYLPEDWTGWGRVDRAFWMPIWLFQVLHLGPASPAVLAALQIVFKVSLLFAAAGLATRAATTISFGLGLYLFGLPHNFGHTYHFDALLVLVFGVMALSRAGDGVSIDAAVRARRVMPSAEYTWPVRLVWVATALVFFAAGLSKLRHGGLEWVFSDNMAIVLVKAQHHVSDADPVGPWGLWISASPWRSRAIALVSLATETLFPLALVSQRARAILVPAAFGMLVGIRVLMGPTFGGFLSVFAFWVPWQTLLVRRTASGLDRDRYAMLFDGGCGLCGRAVRVVQRLDTRSAIEALDIARDWPAIAARFPALSQSACLDEMHVVTPRGRIETGYCAYRALAQAIPWTWPLLPVLYVPGARAIGDRVYRAVARRRATTCRLESSPLPVRIDEQ